MLSRFAFTTILTATIVSTHVDAPKANANPNVPGDTPNAAKPQQATKHAASPQREASSQPEWKQLGLLCGGAGLMFLGGAAAYSNSASQKRDFAKQDPMNIDEALLNTGDEHAHTALILGVVGGTAVVGGVLAYFLGGRSTQRKALTVTPVIETAATPGQYSGFALSAKF